MTIVLRHNQTLELNRTEYRGPITLAELAALADFLSANPNWLSYDCLNVITPSADFEDIDFAALDEIFKKYRAMFEPRHVVIVRRSPWICQSPAAQPHLRHWIGDRDTRTSLSSDLRQFDTFTEAGAWLVLTPDQAAALERGDGFNEVVSHTIPNSPRFAAAR